MTRSILYLPLQLIFKLFSLSSLLFSLFSIYSVLYALSSTHYDETEDVVIKNAIMEATSNNDNENKQEDVTLVAKVHDSMEIRDHTEADRDVAKEEVVPTLQNSKGKRAAPSPTPPGDQPLNKRQRQSSTEEEFDPLKMVENTMKAVPSPKQPGTTLCQQCAKSCLAVAVGRLEAKMAAIDAKAAAERERAREFAEAWEKDWKLWENMRKS
ncbi:hypothetical protein V8C35DRAFT_288418 [Trichoderma chlorosporum]